MDRDCKTCVWSSPWEGESNGCVTWSCEYINKREAAEAWKELHKREENNGGSKEEKHV